MRYSPSGIPHYRAVLEHRSTQWEAGAKRLVACRITVQCSGEPLAIKVSKYRLGEKAKFDGFLSTPLKGETGFDEPVLHALEASLID